MLCTNTIQSMHTSFLRNIFVHCSLLNQYCKENVSYCNMAINVCMYVILHCICVVFSPASDQIVSLLSSNCHYNHTKAVFNQWCLVYCRSVYCPNSQMYMEWWNIACQLSISPVSRSFACLLILYLYCIYILGILKVYLINFNYFQLCSLNEIGSEYMRSVHVYVYVNVLKDFRLPRTISPIFRIPW